MTIINGNHYYTRESDDKEGFAVVPTGKDGSGVCIIVHGIGEVGDGSLTVLQNIVEGWDYDGDGPLPRQYGMSTPEFRKNLAAYNFHGVHINYKDRFTPSDFNYVIDTVVRDFKANAGRIGAIAFSLGGAQLIPYITSSVENAHRLVLAVLCAPVNPGGNWKNVVDAKLQVIGATCDQDYRVSSGNIRKAIADINALSPVVKPYYIEWKSTAHSGLNEMMACTDPLIPQNIFAYMNEVTPTDRKQYPTAITKPTDPVIQPPPVGVKADFNITPEQLITASEFILDASASTGATSYFWDVTPDYTNGKPGGWGVKPEGGAFGGPKKRIYGLTDGDYLIKLTVNGSIKSDARRITVKLGGTQPIPKPVPKSILMSDGTSVTTGWKITSPTGEIFSL